MSGDSYLASLFQTLLQGARRSGQDRRAPLRGGAEIVVRSRLGQTTVTFKRRGAKVGDTELVTFRLHCQIPPDAERIPATGQKEWDAGKGRKWYYVGFRWKDGATPERVVRISRRGAR